MPCFQPLKAIKKKFSNQYRIMTAEQSRRADFAVYLDYQTGELVEPIEIPCGRCPGCLLERSKQWANRCVLESLDYDQEQCWFLTLTIDDDHLKDYIRESGFASVRNADISTFMKALRQAAGVPGVRFFASSEYGDRSFRPHYHIIVYGLTIPDLQPYKNNFEGDAMYMSAWLDNIWKKGFVCVAEFNWKTAAYTARYCVKKLDGFTPKFFDDFGLEKESTRMSRMPGIAARYLAAHINDIYELDEIVLHDGRVIAPPKYFDKKVIKGLEDGSLDLKFGQIKDQRKRIADLRSQVQDRALSVDPYSYLDEKYKESNRIRKMLKRSL